MKTPSNRYIVAVPDRDKVSENLYMPVALGDTYQDWRPVFGKILAAPAKFTNYLIASESGIDGIPVINLKDLEKSFSNIQMGDTVILSHRAFHENEQYPELSYEDGIRTISVQADMILGKYEDGKIIATGGRSFILPEVTPGFESKYLVLPEVLKSKKKVNFGKLVSIAPYFFTHDYLVPGCNVAYIEAFAEWIEVDGVKYDVVFNYEITAYEP